MTNIPLVPKEAITIHIRHDDPEVEAVFEKLRKFCKWRVEFRDSVHVCECLKHFHKLSVPNMIKIRISPTEIMQALSEYECVGDWG